MKPVDVDVSPQTGDVRYASLDGDLLIRPRLDVTLVC